ncbi:hypothetical protein [Actinophytocola sp.]|uniref:hypothetical protein n=1 Tax=Actinophytocola sp. TaxID=1872138 RepID=UPI00389A5E9D
MRGPAAVGDAWHVGIVTVAVEDTRAVLDVFGIPGRRRFHTGRMLVPGGVTYLVAAPPADTDGVAATLTELCTRYDPPVLAQVGGDRGSRDVLVRCAREPVESAVDAFFAAAGEPAGLPGFRGDTPFLVRRSVRDGGDLPRFCATATRRRGGKPLAWAVVHGGTAREAAQTLRYLVTYLRPRMP